MEIQNLSLTESKKQDSAQYFYTGITCQDSNSSSLRGAICICFNEDENDTITEILNESLCTNQKAELHAIYTALCCITNEVDVSIISKSEYAVKCINVWSNKWKENNWKSIPSNTSDNRSIVKSIVEILEELANEGKNAKIYHWSDIPNKKGNNIAYNTARDALIGNT